MIGCVDQINKQTISGWIVGGINSLTLKIDGSKIGDLIVKEIPRPDAQEAQPDKKITGFSISTPYELLDGSEHLVEILNKSSNINQSPIKFTSNKNKILFIHIPKNGGTSVNNSLRMHKSEHSSNHIEFLLNNIYSEYGGYQTEAFFGNKSFKKEIKDFERSKKIPSDVDWLAGHIDPLDAARIIYKYHSKNTIKNFFLERKKRAEFNFDKTIGGFEVFSMVRNPMDNILSGLNWFNNVYSWGEDKFYNHHLPDLQKMSFYLSRQDKSIPDILSKILNLGMLNNQSRIIAPNLIVTPDKKTAITAIKQFQYIGRLENFSEMIKKITYPGNNFDLLRSNITTEKLYTIDDISGSLKNFLYEKMKPDLILYETVCEYFG